MTKKDFKFLQKNCKIANCEFRADGQYPNFEGTMLSGVEFDYKTLKNKAKVVCVFDCDNKHFIIYV